MIEITSFIKDWIPPIGVIVGASWIFFKWVFDQRLRSKKEIPALDGSLETKLVPLNDVSSILTVYSNWQNTSPFPVYVDIESTKIDIFIISEEYQLGAIDTKKGLGDPIYQNFPLKEKNGFIFEPNKRNQIRSHFILQRGKIYFIRAKLYRDPLKHDKKVFAWTREEIVDTRKIEQKFRADG